MQKFSDFREFIEVTPDAQISVDTHGERAVGLQRLIRLALPVPQTVALPFDTVSRIGAGHMPDMSRLAKAFGAQPLVSVRPSSPNPQWGGPRAMLNVGMNCAVHDGLRETLGDDIAHALYLRFIQSYAVDVARLDPDLFAETDVSEAAVEATLALYEEEAEDPFPQTVEVQLAEVLRSMARSWDSTSARLLREARGAPTDTGLGLVVQRMALGIGAGESGSGVIQFVAPQNGERQVYGRYLRQSLFQDAFGKPAGGLFLQRDSRGLSLQDVAEPAFQSLMNAGQTCRDHLRDEMEIAFTLENGELRVLDVDKAARSSRAALSIAVSLANSGVITKEEAVLRVAPPMLAELLHSQVDTTAPRDAIVRGIAGSPGAATGKLVFSASAAQASAAQGEPCILVRRETMPEDIRGMHVAQGILTERGGMTSHAAVIARGLGLPCVVGANDLRLSTRKKRFTCQDGRVFSEGDLVTLDGTTGELLAGAVPMMEPALDDNFQTLMGWADEVRDIGVRANADTLAEAHTALAFAAEGIGLCRTEHMFFDDARMGVMREMIFADKSADRTRALDRLLPMQRDDFVNLFRAMEGRPVTIRLFDPPLHEFLPSDRDGLREMAEGLDLPLSEVTRRVEAMTEFNPMLGLRGVRLGVTMPEIYDMQARAIFEATVLASEGGPPVVPEIMIPLVTARREVELVKTRIDAVAAAVRNATGAELDFRIGVMVETPRAALRAAEIASHCAFLSFGTNDLTQMTYGLSRDDAGRFMGAYVRKGVYPEDPFHRLDQDGVGELLTIGADRGRQTRKDITLSICGEHAGHPSAIAFCREAGFDYISCSPFRVPIARLAAAHLALADKHQGRDAVPITV